MHIRMCSSIYIYIYIYTYTSTTHMHTCMRAYIHTQYTHTKPRAYIHTYTHRGIYIHACIQTCVHVDVHVPKWSYEKHSNCKKGCCRDSARQEQVPVCELYSCFQDLLRVFFHKGSCIPLQAAPMPEDRSQGSNVVRQALDGPRVIFILKSAAFGSRV